MASRRDPHQQEVERRRRNRRWLRWGLTPALALVGVGALGVLVGVGNRRAQRAEAQVQTLRGMVEQYQLDLSRLAESRAQDNRDCEFDKWFNTPLSGEVGRVNNRWVAWVWLDGDVTSFEWLEYSLEGYDATIRTTVRDDGFCAALDVDELMRANRHGYIRARVHSIYDANTFTGFHIGRLSRGSGMPQGTDYLEIASANADDYVATATAIAGMGVHVFERAPTSQSREPMSYAVALGPAGGQAMTDIIESWRNVVPGLRARGLKTYSNGKVVPGVGYSNQVYPVPRCAPP